MRQRTAHDKSALIKRKMLPYALLGLRLNRRTRRRKLTEDQLMLLGQVHVELQRTAILIGRSDLPDRNQVAERLALGLAYDATMFAESMTAIADQARRHTSPSLLLAVRLAAQAFRHVCLLRANLTAEAPRQVMVDLMVRRLAALEPATLTFPQEYPDGTDRLDLPACVRLIRTVAPTNGPNSEAKALLSALGSVALAA